jgi:hypothetical protein
MGSVRGVLHELGATASTLITVLSDGADGPRSLGESASVGPTHHVLDWFHLSMRIQHVAQAAKSWPNTSAEDCEAGTQLSDTVERIRWRLWRGQVGRGLELIGETMATLDAMAGATSPAAAVALKVGRLWVNSKHMYAASPISSSITQRPDDVTNQSRRQSPKARCNGCYIGG